MTVRVAEFKFDVKYINTVEIDNLLGTFFKSNRIFGTKRSKINLLQKTIDWSNTNWAEYKISELKYGNKKLLNVWKYNQVRLVLTDFASVNLY